MAHITVTGVRYNSTIDTGPLPIIDAMDVHSAEAVHECGEAVRESLAIRVKEELVGTGPFERRYAALRLHGSVLVLERRRRQAFAVGALPQAIEVIDLVLAEARRARDVAASFTPESETETLTPVQLAPQPWTQADASELETPSLATVTVSDLLVDLLVDGAATTEGVTATTDGGGE